MTIIVISHRLAMVEDCDLLLVLDQGRVADFGSREDVLAENHSKGLLSLLSDLRDQP